MRPGYPSARRAAPAIARPLFMRDHETLGFSLLVVVIFGAVAAGAWYAWRMEHPARAHEPVKPLPDLRAAAPVRVEYVKVPTERVRVVSRPAKRPEVRRCLGADAVPIYTTEPACPEGATPDKVMEVHLPNR